MGRWREAPEGPHPPASPGTSPQAGKTSGAKRRRGPIPRLRRVLPRERGRQLALADPLARPVASVEPGGRERVVLRIEGRVACVGRESPRAGKELEKP